MQRRTFLNRILPAVGWFSASAIATLAVHPFGGYGATSRPRRLIVIFLRGAVDGLNVVVPYQEPNYYAARPKIAIAKPGDENGAIDLDGRFGLNPALEALMPLWKQQNLAFIHASGSPDPTRSHFDAQDYMETATPGVKKTADGWMNRLLAELANNSPVQALNLGTTTPRIFSGAMPVASLAPGRRSVNALPIDRPDVGAAFDRLYQGQDVLSQTYQEGRAARREILASLAKVEDEMQYADRGAPNSQGFVSDAQRLAQLMVRNPNIQLAFLALGGWDTHINQGSGKGLLSNRLKPLGDGLATLVKRLGSVYQDTTIVVMSEFGRTVAENGNGGTDHGHGNVFWLLGGSIRGGRIYGDWPGLADSQLHESRDLAITTDFRDAIAPVLTQHLKIKDDRIAKIFPNYTPKFSRSGDRFSFFQS